MPPPPTYKKIISRFFPFGKSYFEKEVITIAEKKYGSQEKYDKVNTTFVGLKLNNKTDKDILDAIEGKAKQTEIKRLIRKGLEK